jgi:hypothetical protein
MKFINLRILNFIKKNLRDLNSKKKKKSDLKLNCAQLTFT